MVGGSTAEYLLLADGVVLKIKLIASFIQPIHSELLP